MYLRRSAIGWALSWAGGKKKAKLLTPVTSKEISMSDLLCPGCSSFLQQLIARLIASAVVERLEVVKIDERNRRWLL
jgi:hypothetical protein